MTFKIATWNVNSIAARLPLATRWLETYSPEQRPDIICLQEIKCVDEKFPAAEFEALGYQSLVYGQPAYNGLATLVKTNMAAGISEIQKGLPGDEEGAPRRLLSATINGLRVVNVYIPNGQAVGAEKYYYKLDWLARLRAYFDSLGDPAQPVVLLGDFNVAPDPVDVHDPAAWNGRILFSLPERKALQDVKDWGLEDTFRNLYPEVQAFSWWDYRQAGFRRNLGLRIDHIWVSKPLMQVCREVIIDKEPRGWERPSDHTPVIAAFELVK
jgi:exodeoxyribonuclease-3